LIAVTIEVKEGSSLIGRSQRRHLNCSYDAWIGKLNPMEHSVRTTLQLAGVLVLLSQAGIAQPVAQPEPPPYNPAPYGSTSTQQPPAQATPPQQLDDLVTPIALYPDPLLGEVLAASTYPMEIAEAEQWVRDHHSWKPDKLMKEAKKQNWDPSVQGLAAFPQVLAQLSQDMSWTTQLGNAFLADQAGVMQAVQRMRGQAEARGTLRSGPQETVTDLNQNGQNVIKIEPANPDVWYVPSYNPAYVWGPPAWGYYPPLLYPGVDVGFGWGPGIDLGLYFGGWGGWGWGGWGWNPNWYGGGIFINDSFFHRYGFHHFGGYGSGVWAHDPVHRLGVPYPAAVGGRFGRGGFEERGFDRGGFAAREGGGVNRGGEFNRGNFGPVQRQPFGSPSFEQRGYAGNHSVFGGYHNGGMTRMQSDHGFSSMGGRGFGGGGGFHGGGGGFHGGGGGRR
jgi:hypothetical protein